MNNDLCLPCDGGVLNVRVGAILLKDGKLLMVGNRRADYLYSVGGRIRFGETAEEAVVRETYEETGCLLSVNRLAFVHENFFYGDSTAKQGKTVHEISFFFYMNVPDGFAPVSNSFTEDDTEEFLTWIDPDTDRNIYPNFFKTELKNPSYTVKHFVTDERSAII